MAQTCSVARSTAQARDESPRERAKRWGNFDVANVDVLGDEKPGLQVSYNAKTRTIWAVDRHGMETVRVELPPLERIDFNSTRRYSQTYQAVVLDDMLVVHLGDAIYAISRMGGDSQILWWEQLVVSTDESEALEKLFYNAFMQLRRGVGMITWPAPASNPQLLAETPSGGLCFQRGRELRCVEPRTGELFWSRDDFPKGCDLHIWRRLPHRNSDSGGEGHGGSGVRRPPVAQRFGRQAPPESRFLRRQDAVVHGPRTNTDGAFER